MPGTGIIAISAAYAKALPFGHDIATLAEVWRGDEFLKALAIEDTSTLTNDRNQTIRRTCSATLTDPTGTLVPQTAADLLTPFGNELVLYRGITFPDGSQELIQCGVFGLEDVVIKDSAADLTITLNGFDRSRTIQRAGFDEVYTIPAKTNVGFALQELLAFCWQGPEPLVFNFQPTDAVTQNAPTVYGPGDDPILVAQTLASACGHQLSFDAAGAATFESVPDPGAQLLAASYDEGPTATWIDLTRTISRARAPNKIIRDGQGTGILTPIRAIAVDDNPNSPTYIGGSYGVQRDYNASSLYATQAQAQAAADADLRLALGSVEALNVNAVPKPDHDVDDVVEVTRVRSGLANQLYVLDTITMGFGTAGLTQMTGRQVAA